MLVSQLLLKLYFPGELACLLGSHTVQNTLWFWSEWL